jgi:hypothetical protein
MVNCGLLDMSASRRRSLAVAGVALARPHSARACV